MGTVHLYKYWPLMYFLLTVMHIRGTTSVCAIKLRLVVFPWLVYSWQADKWHLCHHLMESYRPLYIPWPRWLSNQSRKHNYSFQSSYETWSVTHLSYTPKSDHRLTFGFVGNTPSHLNGLPAFYWSSRMVRMSLSAWVRAQTSRRARWCRFILVSRLTLSTCLDQSGSYASANIAVTIMETRKDCY
jgi:hypothetical protein